MVDISVLRVIFYVDLFSLGRVFTLLSHALHREVAQLTEFQSVMSDVSTRMEVQGMTLSTCCKA